MLTIQKRNKLFWLQKTSIILASSILQSSRDFLIPHRVTPQIMNILCGLNLLIPVINYYETRYDYLTETKQSKKYIYNATVHSWDKIQVINTKLENSIEGNSISVVDSNGTILRQYGNKETLYAYYNGSGYRHINASETNFSLPKSYVVEMNLQYEEAKGKEN